MTLETPEILSPQIICDSSFSYLPVCISEWLPVLLLLYRELDSYLLILSGCIQVRFYHCVEDTCGVLGQALCEFTPCAFLLAYLCVNLICKLMKFIWHALVWLKSCTSILTVFFSLFYRLSV